MGQYAAEPRQAGRQARPGCRARNPRPRRAAGRHKAASQDRTRVRNRLGADCRLVRDPPSRVAAFPTATHGSRVAVGHPTLRLFWAGQPSATIESRVLRPIDAYAHASRSMSKWY